MVRCIFIGIKRTLEALGILEKLELVQIGEGQLFPFLNFQSKVEKDCCRVLYARMRSSPRDVHSSLGDGALERRSYGLQHASKVSF
jgi:hypothetical protein